MAGSPMSSSTKDEAKKQYAIDFWFKPEGDQLTLMDIRVQKGPKQDGDGYYMVTRMPVAWWWLPVQEHPGDMEVTRAWQVMSAIHNYIATHKDAKGALEIKDDKTGETLPLDFVEIHQPVRHLKKDGEYFVCTDFRKPGSKDEYYDIDFWVNQKSGKLEVDNVKIHKIPVQEDGVWLRGHGFRRHQLSRRLTHAACVARRASSRRESVSRVDRSARPSTRVGLKWRWKASTTFSRPVP